MKVTGKFWFFPAVLFLFHLFYFGYQSVNRNYYLDDSSEYLAAAENIRSHGVLYAGGEPGKDPVLFTKRTPAYPAFLALFLKKKMLLLFIQLLISFFSILLVRRLAFRFGYRKEYDPYLLILLFFSPAQFIYSQMIMAEIMLQFFLMLFLYAFLNYLHSRKNIHLVFANLFLVFAMFSKPVMYLFIIPELLVLLFLAYQEKKYKLLLPVLIPVMVLLLYMYRNYSKTGYVNFSSIQTVNLVDYNTYFFLMEEKGESFASEKIDSIRNLASLKEEYAGRMNSLNSAALGIISKNAVSYMFFHMKGTVRFFLDPGRFDLSNFFGLEKENGRGFLYYQNKFSFFKAVFLVLRDQSLLLTGGMLMIFLFNLVKLTMLVIFAINRNIPVLVRIIILTLVSYLAFLTGPLGASRFSMPVIPVIIIFGLTGFLTHKTVRRGLQGLQKSNNSK